jgi:hypothetical protein
LFYGSSELINVEDARTETTVPGNSSNTLAMVPPKCEFLQKILLTAHFHFVFLSFHICFVSASTAKTEWQSTATNGDPDRLAMVVYDTVSAAARCHIVEASMASRKVSVEPSTDCQFQANQESPEDLAIVVYDPVDAAARCPALIRAVDPCMAPKKVSGQPDYTDSPFDLGYTHVLPEVKNSRRLYKLVESGTTIELDRYLGAPFYGTSAMIVFISL